LSPFVFINTLVIATFSEIENRPKKQADDELFVNFSLSIIITGFTFYLIQIIYPFWGLTKVMILVGVLQMGAMINAWWAERKSKKKK